MGKEEVQAQVGAVRGLVEATLAGERYAHGKTGEWGEAIGDGAAELLRGQLPDCKLVVNVLLMEKSDAGFKCYNSAVWSDAHDDLFVVRHEVADIRCIVTVWALSMTS